MRWFTQEKFLSLPYRRQHKNAGEYLRTLFDKTLPLNSHYREMEKWLHLPPIHSEEELMDRFHHHMQEALVELKEHNLLIKQADTLSAVPYGPIYIFLEDLRSAFNIGNILRTVEAFRLGTVVFSENTPNGAHLKVKKTAMGAAPPWKQGSLELCPRPFIALETTHNAPSIYDFHFPETFTLLLGNEERGLKESTLSLADHIVQIPLVGSKNSLNVASAFAISASFIYLEEGRSSEVLG